MMLATGGAYACPIERSVPHGIQFVQDGEPNFEEGLIRPKKGEAYGSYYCNRFAYSVDYPASFAPQAPSYNGDGRSFVSGKSRMLAYSHWNVDTDSKTIAQMVAKEYEEARQPTDSYKRLGKDFFVLSGTTSEGIIYYRKGIFKYDRWVYIYFEYPQSEKKKFDSIVSHVVGSLHVYKTDN